MNNRPSDALKIATSIFAEGLSHLNAGRLADAQANFEMSLSINQKYLQPASLDNISCYQHLAAVHDKLGNLKEAASYLEKAKSQLSAPTLPTNERSFAARKKRGELLKQVQHQLDLMPRTAEPKVGAGVPLAELRNLYASLSSSGDQQLASGDLEGAKLTFEQALALCRTHHIELSGGKAPAPAAASSSSAPSVENSLGNGAAVAIADTLSRLAEVHSRSGQTLVAEAHLLAAIDVLLGDVPADDIAHADYIYSGKGPFSPPPQPPPEEQPEQQQEPQQPADAPSTPAAAAEVPYTTLERRQSLPPMPIDDNGDDEEEDEVDALAEDLDAVSLELHLPPQTPTTTTEMAQARQERLKSLRESVRSLQSTPAYKRACSRVYEPNSPRSPMPSPLRRVSMQTPPSQQNGHANNGASTPIRASPLVPPNSTGKRHTPHPPPYPPPAAATPTSAQRFTPRPPPGPPPGFTSPSSQQLQQTAVATPASSIPSSPGTPSDGLSVLASAASQQQAIQQTAASLAVAANSAMEAVGAAQAAQSAAAAAATTASPPAQAPAAGGPSAAAAEEEEDEFAWRKGQESDDEDEGPIDDRVEGAIEAINVSRDAMTEAQLEVDAAQRRLSNTEAHTNSELKRLQEENAGHLAKMAAYELAKAVSAEAAQEAEEAVAKIGRSGAHKELQRAKQTQAESMRMAMQLQKTFDQLVPYFVYRSVLESELEEKHQALATAQAEAKGARRTYNRSMDYLEQISSEIQQKQADEKREKEEKKAAEEEAAREAERRAEADAQSDAIAMAMELAMKENAAKAEAKKAAAAQAAKEAEELTAAIEARQRAKQAEFDQLQRQMGFDAKAVEAEKRWEEAEAKARGNGSNGGGGGGGRTADGVSAAVDVSEPASPTSPVSAGKPGALPKLAGKKKRFEIVKKKR